MKSAVKRVGLGIVLWAVAYAAAIPLLPLMRSDPIAFKAAMVFIGSILAAGLAVYYLMGVEKNFLREAALLAVTWLAVNWCLDIVALLPFSHQTLPQYLAEIGGEYVGLMAPVIAMGYLLERKAKAGR